MNLYIRMKITKEQLLQIIREEIESVQREGRKAAKTVGAPPYREQGSTESQAQQKAAGAAYGCRKKRGAERKKCAAKLKKRGGAAWNLFDGEITFKQLKRLAQLGNKVRQHKNTKEPKHLKSLPGHVIPKKD